MTGKKLGICQWCIPATGSEVLQIAADMGFAGVEIDMGFRKPERELLNPTVRAEFLEAKKRTGIETPSLAFNGLNLNDPARREERLEIMKQSMEVALDFGVKILQLPSFLGGGIRNEAEFQETAFSLKYFCQMAAPYGMIVGTENQLDVEQNLRLMELVGEDNFAIYYDNANPYLFDGREGMPMMETLYPYFCEIHIKDYALSGDKPCKPLGQGECYADEAMRFLKDRGYDKWLIVENKLSKEELMKDIEWIQSRM